MIKTDIRKSTTTANNIKKLGDGARGQTVLEQLMKKTLSARNPITPVVGKIIDGECGGSVKQPTPVTPAVKTGLYKYMANKAELSSVMPAQIDGPVLQRVVHPRESKECGEYVTTGDEQSSREPTTDTSERKTIRGHIQTFLYSSSGGIQCVIFKETELPEKKKKKKGNTKGSGTKKSNPKSQSVETDDVSMLDAPSRRSYPSNEREEEEDTDGEDLDHTDGEDDSEEEDSPNLSKRGYDKSDGFVASDSEEDRHLSSDDEEYKEESSSSSSSSEDETEETKPLTDEPVITPDKPLTDEPIVTSDKPLVDEPIVIPDEPIVISDTESDQQQKDEEPLTIRKRKHDDREEDFEQICDEIDHTVGDAVVVTEAVTEKEGKPRQRTKRRIVDTSDITSTLSSDVASMLNMFGTGKVSKTKSDEPMPDISDQQHEDAVEEIPEEGEPPMVKVEAGKLHKVTGKFPTTSPLVFMDLLVESDQHITKNRRPDSHRDVEEDSVTLTKVTGIYRMWEGDLTKRKLINCIVQLQLADAGAITKALQPTACRMTDPIGKDALIKSGDSRFNWMFCGLLNTDDEMKMSSVVGVPIFEAIRKRKRCYDEFVSCVRDRPHDLLFVEEKLPEMVIMTGLARISVEDFKILSPGGVGLYPAACEIYRHALNASVLYGDTMAPLESVLADEDPETKRAALDILVKEECVFKTADYVGLRSAWLVEKKLAQRIVQRCSFDKTPIPIDTVDRKTTLDRLRPDMVTAITEVVECEPMSMVIGPDELGMFVTSALSKLYPKIEICVICCNPTPRYTVPNSYNLQKEWAYVSRKLVSSSPPGFVVVIEAQLDNIMQVIPNDSKLTLIGDDLAIAPIPPMPDMGKPFIAMSESLMRLPPKAYVGSQIAKSGPEAVIEELICSDDPMNVLTRSDSVGICQSLQAVYGGGNVMGGEPRVKPDIVLVSTWSDRKETFGNFPHDPANVFAKGDYVVVKSGGARIGAGRLMDVRTGMESLLSCTRNVRLPLARSQQVNMVHFGKATSMTYVNTEVTAALDNSGSNGKHVEINTNDRYFMEKLEFAVIRRAPPFTANNVVMVVSRRTTMSDLYAAGKIAKNKLTLVGSHSIVLQALGKKVKTLSALGYILDRAKIQ